MSIERARAHLQKYNLSDRIRELDVSSATVSLAAQAIGCEENRIAKSLSFMTDDGPILVVAAGDAKVDNSRYKGQFHCKAKMLAADEVDALIGHAVGGVCPFGINEGVRVFLDASLRRFETVFPACGSSNSVIELTLSELENASESSGWVDVCKAWRDE